MECLRGGVADRAGLGTMDYDIREFGAVCASCGINARGLALDPAAIALSRGYRLPGDGLAASARAPGHRVFTLGLGPISYPDFCPDLRIVNDRCCWRFGRRPSGARVKAEKADPLDAYSSLCRG